jgi:protein-tyrosine phosphatase
MAERLGRAYLDDVLGADAAIELRSAGTHAVIDSEMHPDSALVLRGFGGEPGDFRAQQLTDRLAMDADLTLTMTRTHRRDVLALAPRALARTFTVREAAHLLELVSEDPVVGATLPDRARQLVGLMASARAQRQNGPTDDVHDPIGQPLEVHQEVGDVIVESLLPVLGRVADLHAVPNSGAPDSDRFGAVA